MLPQVMLLRNEKPGGFVNGDIGKVVGYEQADPKSQGVRDLRDQLRAFMDLGDVMEHETGPLKMLFLSFFCPASSCCPTDFLLSHCQVAIFCRMGRILYNWD